jgi:hypothetical protein
LPIHANPFLVTAASRPKAFSQRPSILLQQEYASGRNALQENRFGRAYLLVVRHSSRTPDATNRRLTMSGLKITSVAAALLALAVATQAHAAPRHHNEGYANTTSTFDNTYRDPTTREALDEGAW